MAISDDDDVDALAGDDEGCEHTYLTFQVAGEEYAVPVAHVTEIVRLPRTHAIPDVAPWVRGVMNLRGKVIPLLDVRGRFGLPEEGYTDRTVVVVLDVGEASTGLVVDGVSDVTEIGPDQIEAHAGLHGAGGRSLVKGLGRRADRVSFVLDVEHLLDGTAVRAAARPQ